MVDLFSHGFFPLGVFFTLYQTLQIGQRWNEFPVLSDVDDSGALNQTVDELRCGVPFVLDFLKQSGCFRVKTDTDSLIRF